MKQMEEKRISQKTAAEELGIGVRQIKRLWRSYREEGARGLASKQRGQPGHHQLDPATIRKVLNLTEGTLSWVWANTGTRKAGGAGRAEDQSG